MPLVAKGSEVLGEGVSVDPAKVEVISNIKIQNLMEQDERTPSVRKIKSFLGMVFYYQHFIPNCSAIAKPLFALTAGQKRKGHLAKEKKFQGVFRKLIPADWTEECNNALDKLKAMLLECAVLAHPDFEQPFILSTDASLDGLGAVLSQVPYGAFTLQTFLPLSTAGLPTVHHARGRVRQIHSEL